MKTDIEIAREAESKAAPIADIAEKLGIKHKNLTPYGWDKVKVATKNFDAQKVGKLVLVTAMSPTPAGEGKTTVSIGLADGLNAIGEKAVLALREPSMGPVFGMKGGAAGGGYAQVIPMEDINLHFTGDFAAIAAANNLIAAVLDNHIYQGTLDIDPERVLWKRVVDTNDRVLREITVGQGAKVNGVERQDGFDIVVASEIMAVFCLATGLADLKKRLGRIVVAFNTVGKPVTVTDLGCVDAAAILLKVALKPNLVQTLEGNAAFVHGGPFANIAHGCNSILATQAALTYGDWAVTEAGFGADLGAEKFMDIVSPVLGKSPDVVVIVATCRALKFHGGAENYNVEDVAALEAGFINLRRHIRNMQKFGAPVVVAINRFGTDTEAEISRLKELVSECGISAEVISSFVEGSKGAVKLAELVKTASQESAQFESLQNENQTLDKKLWKLTKYYGGEAWELSEEAQTDLAEIEANGWQDLPICVAKTPASFSDDAKVLGAPEGWTLHVRRLIPKLGAGFIVALTGKVLTMPGLPKEPAALRMTISDEGEIEGLS
ncbi:MAG: formate--tetrahydrofolate ligase [Streptococcaceae bacterium]|nr:formate--tetrahydrofolate ligase [Streptococcaceae bacterium]